MSRCVWLLTTITVAAIASGAPAQFPDPGPDSMGLYFLDDQDSYVNEIEVYYQLIEMYVVLAGPSRPCIAGWTFAFDFDSDLLFVLGANLAGSGLNIAEIPQFVVGLAVPLPAAEYVVLATVALLVLDSAAIDLYGGPPDEPGLPNYPVYINCEDLEEFVPCAMATDADGQFVDPETGWTTIPLAVINGEAPIAAEPQSWSRVKGLYR